MIFFDPSSLQFLSDAAVRFHQCEVNEAFKFRAQALHYNYIHVQWSLTNGRS